VRAVQRGPRLAYHVSRSRRAERTLASHYGVGGRGGRSGSRRAPRRFATKTRAPRGRSGTGSHCSPPLWRAERARGGAGGIGRGAQRRPKKAALLYLGLRAWDVHQNMYTMLRA